MLTGMLAGMSTCFDHEKLDVYRASMAFVLVVNDVVKGMPKGQAYLNDQLRRAGILDVCRHLQLVDPQIYAKGRELLLTNRSYAH